MNIKLIPKVFTLERVANGAVLLSVLVAFSPLCYNYATRNTFPKVGPGLTRGRAIPQVTNYSDFPQTLLLVLSTECEHCQSSVPFYQKLIAADRKTGHHVHIVAVFSNDIGGVKRFLRENQLEVDAVPNVSPDQLMVGGTPSLILLNTKGEVADFWLGKLSPDQEPQIISSIFRL